MSGPSKKAIVSALLETHGTTYCQDLGIDIAKQTPAPLFRWLTASILFSARISADQAVKAAGALAHEGLTTAHKMAEASWEQRVDILNRNGYARFDEKTASMLGDTADFLLDTYDGDLRKLRDAADRDPRAMRDKLKDVKGLGDVGVDIFFREAQSAWTELYPFADKKSLSTAHDLGLEDDAQGLARHVAQGDFARLVTALVKTNLGKDADTVRQRAG